MAPCFERTIVKHAVSFKHMFVAPADQACSWSGNLTNAVVAIVNALRGRAPASSHVLELPPVLAN